ncbi:hypothetical protein Lesp01_81460 [Lentzea sp. NBRC 102530]|nr:hypothetical protein Lesp01_81460 [Lentzea sp. NBRC 102530]
MCGSVGRILLRREVRDMGEACESGNDGLIDSWFLADLGVLVGWDGAEQEPVSQE